MSEKATKVQAPKMVKYIAVLDCTYKNRWTRRGTVIEVPEGTPFTHRCFEKYDPNAHIEAEKTEMFDKAGEEIKTRRVNSVMIGVYRREN